VSVLNFIATFHHEPQRETRTLCTETPEYMAQLREKFGLDKPLPVQLAIYLKNVLSFDLGYSFRHDMPVAKLVLDRFVPTLLFWGCLRRPDSTPGAITLSLFLH